MVMHEDGHTILPDRKGDTWSGVAAAYKALMYKALMFQAIPLKDRALCIKSSFSSTYSPSSMKIEIAWVQDADDL